MFVQKYYHPESTDPASFQKLVLFFVVFLFIDFIASSIAFALERRHPGRFIPRYSMVMFHAEIPYAVAERRGALQAAILEDATAGLESLQEIDWPSLDDAVRARLPPLRARDVPAAGS